jgi:hypothetical protein
MSTFDYWRDIWEPMTREHYATGGCYIAVTYALNEAGRIVRDIGATLTIDEAIARRKGTVLVIYPIKHD